MSDFGEKQVKRNRENDRQTDHPEFTPEIARHQKKHAKQQHGGRNETDDRQTIDKGDEQSRDADKAETRFFMRTDPAAESRDRDCGLLAKNDRQKHPSEDPTPPTTRGHISGGGAKPGMKDGTFT